MALTIIGIIVVAAIVLAALQYLLGFAKNVFKNIAAANGTGFRKVINYFKNRKTIKEEKKLNKALMIADFDARLNAAKQNPNYKNHAKVAKILKKREYKAAKKAK